MRIVINNREIVNKIYNYAIYITSGTSKYILLITNLVVLINIGKQITKQLALEGIYLFENLL